MLQNSSNIKINRICLIICYFGNWPSWFGYFLESCRYNQEIDWLIFSDNNLPHNTENNIKFFHFRKEDFNHLATRKLGFSIAIQDPYKLCDFKPTYGKIFEDFITDYAFWGYCDIDLIFGNIRNFITQKSLDTHDVISTYKSFLSGPFCLFRNQDITNMLFKKCSNYIDLLKNKNWQGFDENIIRKKNTGISVKKILRLIEFLFLSTMKHENFHFSIKEFRYQYQWFYKKKAIRKDDLGDMTEAVLFAGINHELKIFFENYLFSDKFYERINRKNWIIKWEDGRLTELKSRKELFAFHFQYLKNDPLFTVSSIYENQLTFTISKTGFKID